MIEYNLRAASFKMIDDIHAKHFRKQRANFFLRFLLLINSLLPLFAVSTANYAHFTKKNILQLQFPAAMTISSLRIICDDFPKGSFG
jgi:hypothetical protein